MHQQPQQQNAELKRVCTNVSSSENHANAFWSLSQHSLSLFLLLLWNFYRQLSVLAQLLLLFVYMQKESEENQVKISRQGWRSWLCRSLSCNRRVLAPCIPRVNDETQKRCRMRHMHNFGGSLIAHVLVIDLQDQTRDQWIFCQQFLPISCLFAVLFLRFGFVLLVIYFAWLLLLKRTHSTHNKSRAEESYAAHTKCEYFISSEQRERTWTGAEDMRRGKRQQQHKDIIDQKILTCEINKFIWAQAKAISCGGIEEVERSRSNAGKASDPQLSTTYIPSKLNLTMMNNSRCYKNERTKHCWMRQTYKMNEIDQ